jgi:Undecaprenyl-phosphate glucose phosphotransferase
MWDKDVMIHRSSQTLGVWFLLWDLVAVAAAWVGAYLLRFYSGWFPILKTPPEIELCFENLPVVLLASLFAFRISGQYEVHRLRRVREEIWAVLQGAALMTLFVMATIFLRQNPYETRSTIAIFAVLSVLSILGVRRLTWFSIGILRRRGFNQNLAIIVGTGRSARKMARALRHASWMGIKNLGFVEDRRTRWTSDLDILGTTQDLPKLIDKYGVEHVFIALPMNRYHEARKVYDILARKMVEVRLVADVPALAGLSLTTTNLDGLPVIGLRESPHYGINVIVKRIMDFALALVALVLLAPVMLLIALAVKLTSRGPVFYAQERCGLNGKPFKMLKFRTMKVDAESSTGPVWAKKDDDRRTPIGAFLRKTSLDELPQFLNVLMGDMAVVGPRPERPHFIQEFSQTIPNYMSRHSVKCGITGWAQVNGWRGNTSLRKRIQYDLYYITHWNPWFDIRILFLTIWRGLVNKNAY